MCVGDPATLQSDMFIIAVHYTHINHLMLCLVSIVDCTYVATASFTDLVTVAGGKPTSQKADILVEYQLQPVLGEVTVSPERRVIYSAPKADVVLYSFLLSLTFFCEDSLSINGPAQLFPSTLEGIACELAEL